MEELQANKVVVIPMRGCEQFVAKVDDYLLHTYDLGTHTHIVTPEWVRFQSGEAKVVLHDSMRGRDVFIISDCFNYSITYKMFGQDNHMSPDDHFSDLKRVISAISGKARRIIVIMTMLYEGRQHKRSRRESLDCALALQELVDMGVSNFVTFDAHDSRVENAIPLNGMDNVHPTYQMLKAFNATFPDLPWDKDNLVFISPDEGALNRCLYYAVNLGVNAGMFYKRRDYTRIVNGKNPVVAHEYLGDNLHGKTAIIVDDMIASGGSIIDTSRQLKEKFGAERIIHFVTFGLFTEGLGAFDEAYKEGIVDKVFTTNLVYSPPELLEREWYHQVDMSKYVAIIINTISRDDSMSTVNKPLDRIHHLVEEHKAHIDTIPKPQVSMFP